MASLAERHPHAQEVFQHTVDVMTNPASTGASGIAGVLVFLHNEITTIVGILTALVLLCQLCAWGYKFYKWLTKDK